MPLFESVTPETVLERILTRMDTDLQTREGSWAYDQAAPIAWEIWQVLMTLNELIEAFYVTPRSGVYLDEHAKLFALARRTGTKAAAKLSLSGNDGTVVPAGTMFYAGELAFELSADAVIRDGGAEGYVRAAQVGQRYNVPAGAINQVLRSVPGLLSFANSTAAEGGSDPESDEALYERLDEKRKRPPTSGNPAHYREWALSVDGVGVARPVRLWKGPGTVLVIIAGHDMKPVDNAIVSACADYIQTQRPVGADVTVHSAKAVTVSVSAQVVLERGASLAVVTQIFTSKLDTYLADLTADSFGNDDLDFEPIIVYVTQVSAILSSTDGVLDFGGLTLNGSACNLEIDIDGIPLMGEVSLT